MTEKTGQPQTEQESRSRRKEEIRESRIESSFVRAVKKAGGLALKFTSQTMNGVPDRLILFKIGKCAFVELKAPGKQLRPLQRKRRKQLEDLGFPVFCVDSPDQIGPVIEALGEWSPGEPFPTGVGAPIPEIAKTVLPGKSGNTEAGDTQPDGTRPAWTQPDRSDSQRKEVVPHEVHSA